MLIFRVLICEPVVHQLKRVVHMLNIVIELSLEIALQCGRWSEILATCRFDGRDRLESILNIGGVSACPCRSRHCRASLSNALDIIGEPANVSGLIKQLVLNLAKRSPDIIRPFTLVLVVTGKISKIFHIRYLTEKIGTKHIRVVLQAILPVIHRLQLFIAVHNLYLLSRIHSFTPFSGYNIW